LNAENEQPGTALFTFTRLELGLIKSMLGQGKEMPPLYNRTELIMYPKLLLVGPMLGAPHAVMVMEALIRRGVEVFLTLGWCGSLQPDLEIGWIFLPENALSEEGASAHYPLDEGRAGSDPVWSRRLAGALEKRGLNYRAGRIWTTDAPFRETREKIEKYRREGILAVDMEASALMTVARFYKRSYAGLMVVSDEVWSKNRRQAFGSSELKNGLTAAAEVILGLINSDE